MNVQQKLEIKKAVNQKIKTAGSQNKAASQLNVNVSTLSKIRQGDPDGLVSSQMYSRIAVILGVMFKWQTAETPDYKRITNICKHAKDEGISRAIVASPGTGKSHTLRSYTAQNNNVFYLEAEEYWTKKVFLKKLITVMGLSESGTNISEMVDIIIDGLNKLNDPLIILDEADKLKDGVLNFYKTFYNKTNAGFVLAGTPYLKLRIDKGVRLNKMCYREIFSRIGGEYLGLYGVTDETIDIVCHANGMTDPQSLNEIKNTANGDLRRVKAEIERLRLIATKNNNQS